MISIINDYFYIRKLSARRVPSLLTIDDKLNRLTTSKNYLALLYRRFKSTSNNETSVANVGLLVNKIIATVIDFDKSFHVSLSCANLIHCLSEISLIPSTHVFGSANCPFCLLSGKVSGPLPF